MGRTVLNVEQTPPILSSELASDQLAEADIDIDTSTTTDEDELIDIVRGYDGLLVHAGVPVTRDVIAAGASLEVIARCGIGIDNVDLAAAADHDITVVNHPTYSVQEVATHALSLALAGFRRVPIYDRATRDGTWAWRDGAPIGRLSEATVGLMGFGSIGRRMATLASGFGAEILAYDPYVPDATIARQNVTPIDLETLCSRSSIVSIHAELTPETAGMIDAAALRAIDDDGVLVNTARGPIVDTDALVAELDRGGLGFVGLDVTDPEPLPPEHPLYSFDNVTVTPHAGWYSERSREELTAGITSDVARVLTGRSPINPVTR